MQFGTYTISSMERVVYDVYTIHLIPSNNHSVFSFLPGQFCQVRNPLYKNPEETHLFSIASSPTKRKYIELCIKVYGNWTKALGEKRVGDTLNIAGPFGKFIWTNDIKQAVFLAGGIGITPMLSILRYVNEINPNQSITLLYGSRTEDTITYKEELNSLAKSMPNFKIVHILSHLKDKDAWSGYRGFITKEIFQKELTDLKDKTYFLCGPPIFVQLMNKILSELNIDEKMIHQELFT